jgi:preprotein translocase subunit SecG
MLNTILTVILFFCAVGIIALVLIQRGKGAEAGAGFGAGASGTVFGARGARTALSRATAVLAAVFMISCLLLTYTGSRKVAAPSSVLDTVSDTAAAPTAPVPAPASVPAPATGTTPSPAPSNGK